MMFFPGAVQAVLIMLLWFAELAGRAGWWPLLPTLIPSTWAHAFLMLYGLFPFFIFGFLLTVYPRWMGGPTVPASRYVTAFAFLAAGMFLFYAGLFTSRLVLAAALALQLAGWGVMLYSLLAVFLQSPKRGPHERLLNLALAAGMLGIACFLVGVFSGAPMAFF
ncbi:MAG TPA: NnrS family protein, partial [Sulfuricaulis sp.]|nr:NnrS family protein [Sulfuricaulis sp.]